jgi:outer membrane protein
VRQVSGNLFDPRLTASITQSHSERPTAARIDPETGQVYTSASSDATDVSVGLSKRFAFGTSAGVSLNTGLTEATGNRSAASSVGINLRQPLLRGFGREATTGSVILARNNLESTLLELESNAVVTIQQTETAYWDLVLAIEALRLARLSLEESQQLLERSRARAQSGAQAEYEILVAEAEVAYARQVIIQREAAVGAAQDRLKNMTGIAQDPDGWDIEIEPTEEPLVMTELDDIESLYGVALQKRPDVRASEQTMYSRTLTARLQRNALLPELDVTGGLSFYGSDSVYSKSLDDLVTAKYPSWRVGMQLSMPIGNNSAEAQYRTALLRVRQAELQERSLRLSVQQEVRAAARNVVSTREEIAAAEVSVNLGEANLHNERERLRLGLATNYDVLLKERDLAQSRQRLLQARISHQKSIIALQAATGELLESRGIRVAAREE